MVVVGFISNWIIVYKDKEYWVRTNTRTATIMKTQTEYLSVIPYLVRIKYTFTSSLKIERNTAWYFGIYGIYVFEV